VLIYVAPFGYDGMVVFGAIRQALESQGYVNTCIWLTPQNMPSSITVPLEGTAVGSAGNIKRGNKKDYQMDPA